MPSLKLGTRRSLLAWAQSSWVAHALEVTYPGLKIEMIGIDTQGDKILDKPLSQIDGKEFFTAELDHALLKGEVDFTVHSMKDLALDRPPAIELAAVPKRELPHDIIVFHETALDRIRQKEEIRVGTSSPRRLTLIPDFLKKALPAFDDTPPALRFVEIRGNVNTRLGRIHEPEGSEKKLDAVVLAFAGLERLALDEKASLELWKLFQNTRFMIPPLRECPTAPAQGALAIEARKEDLQTLEILRSLHDDATFRAVRKEREVLLEWGGGCHQKLGATFTSSPHSSSLLIRGTKSNGEKVIESRFQSFIQDAPLKESFTRVEAADLFDFKPNSLSEEHEQKLQQASLLFVAHSRALEHLDSRKLENKRIWASGSQSWFKLAQKGVWVEGCLEGRGIETFKNFQEKKLLRIQSPLVVSLTHLESPDAEGEIHLPTYRHEFREIPVKISHSKRIFWTSGLPFETVWNQLASPEAQNEFRKKIHACGPGKTAQVLRARGIEPHLFTE